MNSLDMRTLEILLVHLILAVTPKWKEYMLKTKIQMVERLKVS